MFKTYYCLLFLSSFLFSNQINSGVEYYQRRAEGSVGLHADSKMIDKAIQYFENDIKNPANELIAAEYLLRSYYFKGTFVLKGENERKVEYDKGKKLAAEMISKYPDSAELRYWYLTCLGKWAEVYGILTAAKEGVADQMKEHSEKIIATDPDYENGGGYFMLGAVHYKSPYIPFLLSWPDNDDAIKWLQKAVDTGKATPVQQNYLARALIKDGQNEQAISLLKSVLQHSPNSQYVVEERMEIKIAQELIKEIKQD